MSSVVVVGALLEFSSSVVRFSTLLLVSSVARLSFVVGSSRVFLSRRREFSSLSGCRREFSSPQLFVVTAPPVLETS